MATPSSTDTSKRLGECVVCGKETDLRCPTCAKAGLDWMFFCSPEHQALIWKVHKRVCGRKNFEWPILTDKEEEHLWRGRHGIHARQEWEGLSLMLASLGVVLSNEPSRPQNPVTSDDSLKLFIWIGKKAIFQDPASPLNFVNTMLRTFSFDQRFHEAFGGHETVPYDRLRHLLAEDPFGFSTWMIERHNPPGSSTLYGAAAVDLQSASIAQHRLLIFVATFARVLNDPNEVAHPDKSDGILRYVSQACRQVDMGSGTQGTNAKEVMEKICASVLDFIGLDVVPEGKA